MSDETPRDEDEQVPAEPSADETAAPDPAEGEGVTPDPGTGTAADDVAPAPEAEAPAEEPVAEEPVAEEPAAPAEEPVAEEPVAEEPAAPAAEEPAAPAAEPVAESGATDEDAGDDEPETPREKPAIPGADLEVDIVLEGTEQDSDEDDEDGDSADEDDVVDDQPVAATIDLAKGARYKATGKRKTAVARVILKPGDGSYTINGKTLENFFPRPTLQRNIRQPLEAVGYETRMDV